jgi:hypothetical protein
MNDRSLELSRAYILSATACYFNIQRCGSWRRKEKKRKGKAPEEFAVTLPADEYLESNN